MFTETKKTVITRGERAEKVIHADNLRMEGKMTAVSSNQEDFKQTRGERAEIVKHETSLSSEGRFEGKSMSQEEYKFYGQGERAEIIKHADNLKVEGRESETDEKQSYVLIYLCRRFEAYVATNIIYVI